MAMVEKVIIVEGRTDKKKIQPIINEPVTIICTNGTVSLTKIDELIELYILEEKDVYILADADSAGDKLRNQFKRELPEAEHIYIDRAYREVATSPVNHLATVLTGANFDVNPEFLLK
ncbi:toprim domain-containing protein [Bacillus solimangrovi]|uniref:Toprim domain-containing protein n=1 Tax=Bacillus solimangrovi TaxID=1305675 RepID=A0A1E5LDX5_9BACI|nr:toprim domain-containing protein [Bacillus solimangrovi]OEH92276.1 hypothetical protein BFG57_03150 [Bacillus solimangrovi]